jgi:8-oxo-dGTP pyrophosphatase MutT (NUDIX family)
MHVVSCFVLRNNKLLILRRSEKVATYRGKWATVSGYLENNKNADETALEELEEEIGLKKKDLKLLRKGKVIVVKDCKLWHVHPYLFKTNIANLKLDWEHVEYRWIEPKELKNYDTVPKLKEALESVLLS